LLQFVADNRVGGVVAALQARGVPPKIDGLAAVQHSAYHGLNFTRPTAPIRILNANITNNAGTNQTLIEFIRKFHQINFKNLIFDSENYKFYNFDHYFLKFTRVAVLTLIKL
jgi:hypothetical protein